MSKPLLIENESFYDAKNGGWYKVGSSPLVRHRLDGPAVTTAAGTEKWYKDGLIHRVGGPAKSFGYGRKEWWQNGERHREDGPAVEFITDSSSLEEWYQDGALHRIGGPARTRYSTKKKEWYQNGERHRVSGPAITQVGTNGEFWLCGVEYSEAEFNSIIGNISPTAEVNTLDEMPYDVVKTIIHTLTMGEAK